MRLDFRFGKEYAHLVGCLKYYIVDVKDVKTLWALSGLICRTGCMLLCKSVPRGRVGCVYLDNRVFASVRHAESVVFGYDFATLEFSLLLHRLYVLFFG